MTFGNFSILSVHIEFQIKKIHHPLYYTSALLFRRHERLIHTRFAWRRGLLDMILKYALSIYFFAASQQQQQHAVVTSFKRFKRMKNNIKKICELGERKRTKFFSLYFLWLFSRVSIFTFLRCCCFICSLLYGVSFLYVYVRWKKSIWLLCVLFYLSSLSLTHSRFICSSFFLQHI